MDTETQEIAILKKDLSNDERLQFDLQFSSRRKNPTTALILSLFLGTFGIDRLYIGDIAAGIVKMLTLGGLWIWAIIDWFLIMNATRRHNGVLAKQIHDSLIQMRASD